MTTANIADLISKLANKHHTMMVIMEHRRSYADIMAKTNDLTNMEAAAEQLRRLAAEANKTFEEYDALSTECRTLENKNFDLFTSAIDYMVDRLDVEMERMTNRRLSFRR